jgi:hypothetical protein
VRTKGEITVAVVLAAAFAMSEARVSAATMAVDARDGNGAAESHSTPSSVAGNHGGAEDVSARTGP